MSYKLGETLWYSKSSDEFKDIYFRKPFVHQAEGGSNSAGNMLAEAAAIISLLPKPPANILECGCAEGYLCHIISLCGYYVTGIDICGDVISKAINQSVEWNRVSSTPYFCVNDFDTYIAHRCDAIIFNNSLHHSINQEVTLRNAFNNLEDGGIVIINEPGLGHETKQAKQWAKEMDVTEKSTPPYRIKRIAKKIGFSNFKIYPSPGTLFKSLYLKEGLNHHPIVKFFGCLPILFAKHFHGLITFQKQ